MRKDKQLTRQYESHLKHHRWTKANKIMRLLRKQQTQEATA